MMLGAMTIHGIIPCPSVIQNQPELFWGLVASMWLGNATSIFRAWICASRLAEILPASVGKKA